MARVWKPLPKEFPANGATVWVTPSNQYNPPFLATFELATFQFTDIVSSAVMPWWAIARWKPFVPPGFLVDSFAGTSGTSITAHTPDVGGAYALSPIGTIGDFQLDGSNRLFCSAISAGAAPVAALNTAIPPSPDYTLTFEIHELTVTGTGQGMMLRALDRDNGYWFVHNAAGNLWAAAKRVAGTNTILGTQSDIIGAGNTRTAIWTVSGNNHTITTVAGPPITFTDSAFTAAGQVGYYSESAITSTTGDHIKNVVAS